MSRIGKQPVSVPKGVEVQIQGQTVTVKGPRGTLSRAFRPEVSIRQDDGVLRVERLGEGRVYRALHGLSRSLLNNMVLGVTQGFRRELEISGVGYRAQKVGDKLSIAVGFSHPVVVSPPPGIQVDVEAGIHLVVSGADKQAVGQTAALIRAVRPPDPYKAKGITYAGERVRRKAGKAVVKKA
ncbi:MAG: 50S ribosomal protein L6 [Dehalococcoidia bacterium]|nr:50S ribosomal protein L6 [Dehalococcoidia bacterium]